MYLNLKFRCFVTSLVLTISTSSLAGGECVVQNRIPVVTNSELGLFSDVLAAPNGVPLTVYGTDLAGPLVVGGVAMTNCPSIDETVFEETLASIRLAKTTCWLENLPLGETYIDAGSSETLPFLVINGNVQTISSFGQFKAAMQDPIPGDFFLLKGFTADMATDGQTNGGQHILWMRRGEHDATPLNPIALIGYPGDPARFVVDRKSNGGNRAIALDNEGWTLTNLDFDTFWQAIRARGEGRIIGNRVNGMTGPQTESGAGTIGVQGDYRGGQILGNIVTGARTGWRFDHAIYLGGCPVNKGWTVAWNHVVDNDFARGPQIMINSQPPRCDEGAQNKSLASHTISNNIVDTSSAPGRCIGTNSYGWQHEYNSKPPGIMYIENNFLINCGVAEGGDDSFGDSTIGAAVYDRAGNARIRGNTFYKADYGISIGSSHFQSHPEGWLQTIVSDNTFIESNDSAIIKLFLHPNLSDEVTIENNDIR